MTAFDGQQDNGMVSNIIEGAKDISQNRNSFYSNQNAVEIYTGDYEANRLDPSRRYENELNKAEGPLANLYKTTNNPSNSSVFAFPIDLATSPDADTTHFMQFNMYETQSAQLRNADRLSTLLKENPLNEEDNSWKDRVAQMSDEDIANMGLTPIGYQPTRSKEVPGDPIYRQRAITNRNAGTGANTTGVITERIDTVQSVRLSSDEIIQQRVDFMGNQNYRGGVNKRVRTPNPTRTLRQKKYKSKDTCFLYMPHKINNLSLQSYDTPSLLFASILGQSTTALAAAGKALMSGNFADAGKEAMNMIQAAGPIAMRKAIGALDSVASVIGMDTELESAATQLLGKAINPRKELVYNSPELRTFEFSYEFYPRNLKESQMVEAIIKMFRFHSAPALATGGNFLVPPSIFAIKFYKRNMNSVVENPFLLKMRDCALTEVNVDFTPNGNFSAFGSGAPVATTMSLTFKELDINVKDDILEGY